MASSPILRRTRYLALQVTRPNLLPSAHLRERFRRQAEVAAQLDPPNILPVRFGGKGADPVSYAMPDAASRSDPAADGSPRGRPAGRQRVKPDPH